MELIEKAQQLTFVVASGSPRRRAIFEQLGLPFRVASNDVDEHFDPKLRAAEIPMFLSRQKADGFTGELGETEVLVTADTVVWIDDKALNKPTDMSEARDMLRCISGQMHEVITGVTLRHGAKTHTFSTTTRVWFHALSEAEIEFYLSRWKPLDKAGAYGIQEFIGYIGIQRIDGDFYNVVGFPVQAFWKELAQVLQKNPV